MKRIENYDVKIFADHIDELAEEQIRQLLSIDVFGKCKIRIMPDVHVGAGCVIGFTGDLGDKVIPNIVGVDIGCGILVQPFCCLKEIDYHRLNEYILRYVPSGRNYRDDKYAPLPQQYMDVYSKAKDFIRQLRCYRQLKGTNRLNLSIGSLGGGNHFIELDKDESGMLYLAVHTGSRNLGKQVALIYQELAEKSLSGWDKLVKEQNRMIKEYKESGRKSELQDAIRELHNSFKMRKPAIPPELSYLTGDLREDYLHDMRLCQQWAILNRRLIVDLLMDYFVQQGNTEGKHQELAFESVHNYIDDNNIIRKGAISAYAGQKCFIPLNMRDGSLICIGKGNPDWNHSAPHGAGRVMSRSKAFQTITMDEFCHSMQGIYTESLSEETKDESPMVYKPKEEIIGNIKDSVEIINMVKPVYNFKASE